MNLRAFFNRALYRQLAAEALGSLLLMSALTGSAILAGRLAGGNVALVLLATSLVTGAMLFVLTVMLAPVSAAHLNPAVTLVEAWSWRMQRRRAPFFIMAQCAGALAGLLIAWLIFSQPAPATPAGGARWVGEFVNAFGLLSVYLFAAKSALTTRAAMLGCYLAIAFWFTGTTSCANPAITLAQGLAAWNGASEIADTASAILAQLAGASVAYGAYRGIIREQ